jgi:ribonuclease P protein component
VPGGSIKKSKAFPKALRLRNRREFLAVQDRGAKVSVDCLLAIVLPNELAFTRLGLTVSSKVGNAVVRNRIRRKLRELFRSRQQALPKGLDVVLIAKGSAANADFAALSKAYDAIALKLSRQFA